MSPAADLYALGIVLAELVTGRPLWDGDALSDLLAKKLAPRPAVAEVPAPLRELVGELIAPRPEQRPGPAAIRARLAALEPARAPHVARRAQPDTAATVVEPARTRTRRWGTIGVALVAVIAAGLIALGLFGGRSAPAQVAPAVPVDAAPDAVQDPWQR